MPKNNQEFWKKKMAGNKKRDEYVSRELRKLGWKVVRIWEHELQNPPKVVAKLFKYYNKRAEE